MAGWGTTERWQREMWEQAQTEVRARLARIDRGETTAPEPVVRCLRAFVRAPTEPRRLRIGGAQ
jgi:hypothetical protein